MMASLPLIVKRRSPPDHNAYPHIPPWQLAFQCDTGSLRFPIPLRLRGFRGGTIEESRDHHGPIRWRRIGTVPSGRLLQAWRMLRLD